MHDNYRRSTRKIAALGFAAALTATSPAEAEVVNLVSDYPARHPQASLLRTLIIQPFGGNVGNDAKSFVESKLVAVQKDNVPYFTIVDGAGSQRTRGLGFVSGTADLNVGSAHFQNRGTRCIRGKVFGKCEQRETFVNNCTRETYQATVNVSMTRASDRKIVYSVVKPVKAERSWCDGFPPSQDQAAILLSMMKEAAEGIERDVAPYSTVYQVRLLEKTAGLTKPAVKAFKNAVKVSTRDFKGSCTQWEELSASGEKAEALAFNLGVCAEAERDMEQALTWYQNAQTLAEGGSKPAAEAVSRVRSLVSAQQAASAQTNRRTNEVVAEQQADAAAARAERNAEAAVRRQASQKAAARDTARAQKRQALVQTHGAQAADAILSGTVQKGMSMAQVRAAIGGPQRTQRVTAGEEQWFYPNRRVVFSGGRVTFVR